MTSKEWKKYKLGEIADINMGQSPKSEYYNTLGDGIAFLQGNRTFGFKNPAFDTYTTLATKTAQAGDVIMSVRAPVGDLNITPINICIGRGLCSIRMKNNNQEFLYYLMKYCVSNLINRESGTVFGSVNRNDISSLEINVPCDDILQREIAKVLSAIDDKIELNNSINNNLEQQAKCYFDEIISKNNNIQYSEIGNICDVKGGKRLPKGVNLITTPNNHPYIRVRDLNNICVAQLNSSYEYVDEETQKSISRYIVNSNDVIVSIVGTIGLTAIIGNTLNNANLTENCVKLTNLKKISPEFLLLFLRSKVGQDAIINSSVGAVQAKLPIKNIQAIKVPIMSDKEFNSYINSIFKNIASNILENEKLIQLRDTLLPKLMSGEIDVDKVEV